MHTEPYSNKPVYRLLALISLLQLISFKSIIPLWLFLNTGLIAVYAFVFFRTTHLFFKTIYTLATITIFALYYGFNFTVEMASSFLVISASLKLLELKSKRDVYLFVFAMFYLASVSFIFEQQITHTVLQLLILVLCFNVLLRLNGGAGFMTFGQQWRSLFKLMALALPLVLVCFMFFPRIAPLWSIPVKASDGAVTGISDSMSPGDIANLSQSSERAFRVEFSGQMPQKRDLYWRGLVLDYFDGGEWRRSWAQYSVEPPSKIDLGSFYDVDGMSYSVMLEPHQQRWVFALDGSDIASSNVLNGDMGQFVFKNDAIQPTRYKMAYSPETARSPSSLSRLPTAKLVQNRARKASRAAADLQVPSRSNPRTRNYIDTLKLQYSDQVELAAYLLKQFNEQAFFYTLKPPALGGDFVDAFLFESRKGFCAHYAGSLAYMLRLAQIPARVVIGYQGGELNEDSNYMIVHQYDAHAWVEAYFNEYGWVRLDPTALVAPNRILYSLERAVQDEGSFLENSPLRAAALHNAWLRWWRLRLDEMNYQWQKWVVNYGENEQSTFVKNILGEYSLSRIIWFFTALFSLISLLVFWFVWRQTNLKKLSKAQKRYLRWLKLMSRFGYKRKTGESPNTYLARLIDQNAHHRLIHITRLKTQALEHSEYKA